MSVHLVVVPDSQNKPKEDNEYADYMWMGEEEQEFEQDLLVELEEQEFLEYCFQDMMEEEALEVLAQLEEEEFLEYCFQDMMEEEALGLFIPPPVPSSSSSSTSTTTTTTLPALQNLSINNSNGDENGHHGNGDIILLPTSDVGAGGDARYETWQNNSADNASEDKHDNQTDSDSSEGGPQR